jgi:hypothetical protein
MQTLGGVGSMLAVLIRQHFLCFFPLPHGHESFRPTLTFDCMKKLLHLVGRPPLYRGGESRNLRQSLAEVIRGF